MNEIFDVNVPWNLQLISWCFENIIRKIKKQFFSHSTINKDLVAFTEEILKKKRKHLLISGKKTCHTIMNSRLRNKCITPITFLQFH